uniref:X2-like carbohydrate binding domain-containing protein n=1 Tax=Kallipyga massiliensis TaxID=1472764 RepID=UPI0026ECEAF3
GEQNAKLTPDWSKAEKLAAGTDLEAALLQAGIKQYVQDASHDEAKYSAKSYAPYKKALDTLESLDSGELKDADTLFNALQEFKAARNNLVDAKKAALKDLLDQAKELKEKDYTKESWDALQKAVKDASKTFNKAMANETEIKNAENALKDAIAALKKTQPAGLADGLYKVPLKLKHAYDGERLSMGNGAVIQTATMDVKNGKATLYMQMRGLHFMGMYGHLYKLFQWRSDGNGADPYSFKGKTEPVQVIRTGKDSSLMGELMEFPEILKLTDCDVTKPYVPVCVWVDAMDAIQSGGATSYDQIRQGAGEQNAKLTPDWSKAEKLAAGTDLEAALLQAGIKQYVQDASHDEAKYSAKSYAPYKKALDTLESLDSGELKDADTLFNALQEFKAARNNLVDAKKAALKDLLDQAKELKEKDYTKESWDALQKAVKDASKTFNKAMANETEIKNAEKALKDAIAALQKKEDPQKAQALKELQEQLAAIRVLKESDYTSESWKPLALQKEAAEALLKKQNTTAEELNQQVKALKAAVDGLKKAAPKQMPMLDSKNQAPKVWKKNETKSFTCRIIAPMMNLKSVKVDGNELAKENYTVTEGSTIITLKESYMNSLAAGKHTLTVAFKEGNGFAAGTVEQAFEVKEAQPNPNPDQPKPNPNPVQPTPNPNPTPNPVQPTPNPNPTPNPGESKPQPTEVYYEVPVELMHAYENNKHSMGNPALVQMAKVFVTKDGLSYELEFTGMEFMNMYGHLWNLFYRNEPCGAEAWTPAVVLEEKSDKDLENKMRKFPSKFRLNCTGEAQKNLPNLKTKSRIHVKVWVDAMDALTNGAKTYGKIVKGSGAQKAYLVFDWSKAVKHESTQPAPNPNEPQPNPNPNEPQPNPNPNETNPGNTEQRGSGTSHGTQSKPQGNTKGQSNITSKIYNVPVKLMHAYENRPSMGNPALVKTARVICQSNGKTQVILSINGMEFMNMYGHVWNFFHYVGGNPVAAQVMKWHNDKNLVGKLQKFPYQFSLLRSGKESRIKVRVWVDAMDALKNGAKTYDKIQPGSGAQDAYLVLDWSNATLIQETHSAQIAGGKESANPASSRQEGIVTNPSTSDSSHITLAAAVLIGGIGILKLMYYFKNRKKA